MSNWETMTDYELVSLYEKGNDSAFDALLRRHQEYVFSYIIFLVQNRDLAEDIFQETFTRAIIAIRNHRYQSTGKFSAWLIRIAHNLVVDNMRSSENCNVTSNEDFPQDILNSTKHSEQAVDTQIMEMQDAKTLQSLLAYLPEPQADVVILRFYEDLSFKEIAERTGVSINTALGRMRYALINLRKLIQKHNLSLAV